MIYPLPNSPKNYPMRVICSWCKKFMYWDFCYKPDETSHGICQICLDKQAAELAALPEDF